MVGNNAKEWGKASDFDLIDGQYEVTILSGPLMAMNKLDDIKIIERGFGKNLFRKTGHEWGMFEIDYSLYDEGVNLVYKDEYGFAWLVDVLRLTEDDKIIGKVELGEVISIELLTLFSTCVHTTFKVGWAAKVGFCLGYFYLDKIS